MKCPFCGHQESKVVDSRVSKEGDLIRRRRECEACIERFTSYERVEELLPMVVKKDGRREIFDRMKIVSGLQKACQKRPVSSEVIEGIVTQIERDLRESEKQEISSDVIGTRVMEALKKLDEVAYVRFASVYRSFKDINEFMQELKTMLAKN